MPGDEYTREYLQYGGQAIIEGVMMRSPRFFSVACRAPDGKIVVQTEAIEKTWVGRQKWLRLPFLRGSLAIIDSMALGSRAMKFASNVQLEGEEKGEMSKETIAKEEAETVAASAVPVILPGEVGAPNRIQDATIGLTMVFGIGVGLLLFVFVPNLIAENVIKGGEHAGMSRNIVTELIKIVFFIGYIALIGQMNEIRRVFCYHGAEHKAINTLEAGQGLELENCRRQTRLHPRCGTSFAVIVLIISLLVFTFVPRYPIPDLPKFMNILVRVVVELAILPLISGVAYEFLRFAGKFRNAAFVNVFFAPGLWSQYLTTREPDADQIEVALTALKHVVASEKAGKEVTDLGSAA
jgi:uncharacterized protein YqhQ